MAWLVRVELPSGEAEQISSLLWDLGTTGIAVVEPPTCALLAGFADEDAARRAVSGLSARGPSGLRVVDCRAVDEEAWVDRERRSRVAVAGAELDLEVGPAFGHGDHPSTRTCLHLLATWSDRGCSRRVVDFGTGTGVLALAALAHGAEEVVAVEIDPAARTIAERNRDANRAVVGPGTMTVIADRAELPLVPSSVDVLVANVLVGVHRAEGPGLRPLLAPGGVAIVGGFLCSQRGEVLAAYPGLAPIDEVVDDGWLGMVLR